MRLESHNPVEISSAKQVLNLLQFKSEFPKEQDLLKEQELLFFVKAVAVRPVISGLEQSHMIVEMQRPDANAREIRQLFDCVCHRLRRP